MANDETETDGLDCGCCHGVYPEGGVKACCSAGHLLCKACASGIRGGLMQQVCCVCVMPLLDGGFSGWPCHGGFLNLALETKGHVVSCIYAADGCEATDQGAGCTARLGMHAKTCPAVHNPCEFADKGCPVHLKKNEANTHADDCAYGIAACGNQRHGCDFVGTRRGRRAHQLHGCPHRMIRCGTCPLKVRMTERADHARVCPGRLVTCPCGAFAAASELKAHFEAMHPAWTGGLMDCLEPRRGVTCRMLGDDVYVAVTGTTRLPTTKGPFRPMFFSAFTTNPDNTRKVRVQADVMKQTVELVPHLLDRQVFVLAVGMAAPRKGAGRVTMATVETNEKQVTESFLGADRASARLEEGAGPAL